MATIASRPSRTSPRVGYQKNLLTFSVTLTFARTQMGTWLPGHFRPSCAKWATSLPLEHFRIRLTVSEMPDELGALV
jgi:hypothetical protein